MKNTLFVLTLSLALFSLPAFAEKVCSVQDGDTFITCGGDKIHLWGIDAPQRKQPYGERSRNALRAMVQNQDVFLQCGKRMSNNSRICHVKLQRRSVNQAMVKRGLAFGWLKFSKGVYRQEEAYARAHRLGVWQQPDGGTRPWIYKARLQQKH